MFAGHIGAGMAIARAGRRVNVGVFVLAALLLDVVLWLLVLLGWESVTIPANFQSTHQPDFVFPWSHGLSASIAWSVLAGAATYYGYPRLCRDRLRVAALIAAAVFSHWLLDALVHTPELPLAGNSSAKVGLGLWNSLPAALVVEALIALAGLWAFVSGAHLSRVRIAWLCVMSVLALAGTVAGMTLAPAPPSAAAMAASSLVTLVLVGAWACWLGRHPGRTPADAGSDAAP